MQSDVTQRWGVTFTRVADKFDRVFVELDLDGSSDSTFRAVHFVNRMLASPHLVVDLRLSFTTSEANFDVTQQEVRSWLTKHGWSPVDGINFVWRQRPEWEGTSQRYEWQADVRVERIKDCGQA